MTEKRLSEESMEALDEAAWTYIEAVRKIIEKHTDAELLEFAEEKVSYRIDFNAYAKRSAYFEWIIRQSLEKAKPVMDAPGFSGVYCIAHSGDMKDCRDQHDD